MDIIQEEEELHVADEEQHIAFEQQFIAQQQQHINTLHERTITAHEQYMAPERQYTSGQQYIDYICRRTNAEQTNSTENTTGPSDESRDEESLNRGKGIIIGFFKLFYHFISFYIS